MPQSEPFFEIECQLVQFCQLILNSIEVDTSIMNDEVRECSNYIPTSQVRPLAVFT